jgi:OOP family OmpA-OmpF porin
MARHTLFMTRRALAIADHSRAIADMPSEEIAFYIEDTLGEIAREIGAPDMRDQKFYIQVDTIKKTIQALLDDHQMLGEKLALKENRMAALQADYEKQVSGLNQQIIFLEGKTEEKQAQNEQLLEQQRQIQRKLEAERQFHRQFIRVQDFFKPEEADVYKKGSQLMIRLKGIRFPVGQAVIMPDSYMLLSKVQKAIKTFGTPSVIIEGHTDSTGTRKLNKQLSLERARSVRQYLIANQTLPAANLSATGFGSERPLASNATEAGRAANRRIDVIIITETDSN